MIPRRFGGSQTDSSDPRPPTALWVGHQESSASAIFKPFYRIRNRFSRLQRISKLTNGKNKTRKSKKLKGPRQRGSSRDALIFPGYAGSALGRGAGARLRAARALAGAVRRLHQAQLRAPRQVDPSGRPRTAQRDIDEAAAKAVEPSNGCRGVGAGPGAVP